VAPLDVAEDLLDGILIDRLFSIRRST